jgi:hypothetical protein
MDTIIAPIMAIYPPTSRSAPGGLRRRHTTRAVDGHVFIERVWRSLKHEDIYLRGYADGHEAKSGIASWITFFTSTAFTRRSDTAR